MLAAWAIGNPLKISDVLVVLAFYGQLRMTVIKLFSISIERLSDIQVALERMESFIKLDTKYDEISPMSDANQEEQKGTIVMHEASFSWHHTDVYLSTLSFKIQLGSFVGIVGPVGSGKSSLFAAILSQMNQISGHFNAHGSSFSYAAQTPWIFADTIRANVLLGKPIDQHRYTSVLHACCLDVDLSQIGPSGDMTMIGEKGVNLSGGQKSRVSLARALYADADIYLLDDPLACVDSIVAKRIYEHCISPRGLLKNKTRLLVTHLTQFLNESDQIIIFQDGRIRAQGHFNQLMHEHEVIDHREIMIEEDTSVSPMILDIKQFISDTQPIITKETSETGVIGWSLWYSLFTAPPLGVFGLFPMILLLIATQFLYNGTNLWLSVRSRQIEMDAQREFSVALIYLMLTMMILITCLGSGVCFFYVVSNGSNYLHDKMLTGLLFTSLRFYESNPSGRILNRVSKDQQVIDEILSVIMFEAVQTLMWTVGLIVVICIVNPWITLLLLPLLPTFFILRRFYLRSSLQLKRMESVTRSPIYEVFGSHFTVWLLFMHSK